LDMLSSDCSLSALFAPVLRRNKTRGGQRHKQQVQMANRVVGAMFCRGVLPSIPSGNSTGRCDTVCS
jgi:hypothetical protein